MYICIYTYIRPSRRPRGPGRPRGRPASGRSRGPFYSCALLVILTLCVVSVTLGAVIYCVVFVILCAVFATLCVVLLFIVICMLSLCLYLSLAPIA